MEKNKKMYFNEKEMNLQIQNYNLNNDCKSFDYICNNLSNIINGMINKEFARNTIVKNNREEVTNECIYEILKSLPKYNTEKGRAFAYFNRIVKNTLIKYYNKERKISSKEVVYSSFFKDTEDEVADSVQVIQQLVTPINNYVEYNDKLSNLGITQGHAFFSESIIYTQFKLDEIMYIFYVHLTDIIESCEYYLNMSKEQFETFIGLIKYDIDVEFEFNDTKFINESNFYKYLIKSIYNLFSALSNEIKSKYNLKTPSNYNMKIPKRATKKIQDIINKSLKSLKLDNKFDTNNILNFIDYIHNLRYSYGSI